MKSPAHSCSTEREWSWWTGKKNKAKQPSTRSRRKPVRTQRLNGYHATWETWHKSKKYSPVSVSGRRGLTWYVQLRSMLAMCSSVLMPTPYSSFFLLESTPTSTARRMIRLIATSRWTGWANSTSATYSSHWSGRHPNYPIRLLLALSGRHPSSTVPRLR